jgi:hypothetical protein
MNPRIECGGLQAGHTPTCTPIHRSDGYSYQKGAPYAQENHTQSAS